VDVRLIGECLVISPTYYTRYAHLTWIMHTMPTWAVNSDLSFTPPGLAVSSCIGGPNTVGAPRLTR
jgi:hypothetical protein